MPPDANIICLLDDEPCVLKAVGRLLMAEGLTTAKFSEPETFLDYARCHAVRLAVIDIRMPGLSGMEVLTMLREESPDTRVIVMTGEDDVSRREEATLAGVVAYFLKPFDGEAFLAAVRKAVLLPE